MSDTFESVLYLTSNDRGEVLITSPEDAQAKVIVTIHNGLIIHGELELLDEELSEEEEEGLLDEDGEQMDLFDILTSNRFIGLGDYDEW